MSSRKSAIDPMTDPLLKSWRQGQGLAVLRLKTDVVNGRTRTLVLKSGDLVFARWSSGQRPMAKGWLVDCAGFLCILREPDIEIVEQP